MEEMGRNGGRMDSISTLPLNLYLKKSELSRRGYEVRSSEVIPIGMRFGPYHEQLIDINKNDKRLESQRQVVEIDKKTMNVDEMNENESNWISCVDHVHQEDEWNMISFPTECGVYFITCRPIPKNTQLLARSIVEDRGGIGKNAMRNTDIISEPGVSQTDETFIRENEIQEEYYVRREEGVNLTSNKERNELVIIEKSSFIAQETNCTDKEPLECGRNCICKSSLKQHRNTHGVENSFKCNTCGKVFIWRSHLKIHELIHTGEKPFKCNTCGKNFRSKYYLKEHEIIHSEENPFKCNTCGKKFARKNCLKKHEVIHTGEKPFKCNICGKKFSSKYYVKEHEIIHTVENPFKCNICGKTFSSKTYFKGHEIIHTGENPFKCNSCGKIFSSKTNLKGHEIIHTGENPFKCNYCGKEFRWKSNLKRHEISHTGEIPF